MNIIPIPSVERLLEKLRAKQRESGSDDFAWDKGFQAAIELIEDTYEELSEELFGKLCKETDQKTEEYFKDPESHLSRNIEVGGVLAWRRDEEDEVHVINDWEPVSISLVAVPPNPHAIITSVNGKPIHKKPDEGGQNADDE